MLDQLLAGADPKTAFDPNGLIDDLTVLNAEMDHHLAGQEPGNRRNGYGRKTVITDTGQIALEVPRDRQARFDPQLIAKYQRRFPGLWAAGPPLVPRSCACRGSALQNEKSSKHIARGLTL